MKNQLIGKHDFTILSLFRFFNRRIISLCKRHVVIFILLLSILYVYYIEVLSYIYNERNWFHIKCSNTSKCLKILLVADPQIIEHEVGHIWNRLRFITKYDSDRWVTPYSLIHKHRHQFCFRVQNVMIIIWAQPQ